MMAIPTPVNSQITDAVTQSNLAVLGNAPAVAMSTVYQSMAHSIGLMFQNSVQAQQQAAISSQAATNLGVIQLYSAPTMAGATATTKLAQSDTSDLLMALLVVLAASKK
jgi:RES domain-containing protein